MKYVVTASQMKLYDTNTIDKIGIPGMVLMERAALRVFEVIDGRVQPCDKEKQKVLILAGTGNNGADGIALARLLSEAGYRVEVWGLGNPDKASSQWKEQVNILTHYSVNFGGKPLQEEYTIVVDALFGVGLCREVSDEYAEALAFCNAQNALKVAVDMPSGIDTDTGAVLGCAFKADVTVTFGFVKRGLLMHPGCEYAGEVVVADIGISERSFFGEEPDMFLYDEPLEQLLPKRANGGNKGTFGKVLLIAGSLNMAGAAVLSARAAYRAGAGMVKVLTVPENREIIQRTVPEALLGTYADLEASLEWADVIGIGPGLGINAEARDVLEKVICHSNLPILIDADGLNLLAESEDMTETLAIQGERGRCIILTPHVGELSRLTRTEIRELKTNLPEYTVQYSRKQHAIIVAKDARSFVAKEDRPVFINTKGNSGMATAGSGDVLAGCILGLMAQQMDGFEAACVGVYAHALAGDKVAFEKGEYGCMAGDIADAIGTREQNIL
ncbi:MAG: NAD(P)H-hydrate dehydratase [Lachnospiraceae bacterium]|nr:NAD(P)H-hydrate dehydratase [Lachnospiraceae bacterium]